MKFTGKVFIILAVFFLIVGSVTADTLTLNDGQVINGTFVGKSDTEITFAVGGQQPPHQQRRREQYEHPRKVKLEHDASGSSGGAGGSAPPAIPRTSHRARVSIRRRCRAEPDPARKRILRRRNFDRGNEARVRR